MSKLVSIIMPTYNCATTISESIESVIEQDYENWELLIINDGSTDNTREVIHAFEDKRIRYFEQSNQGVSAARNVGLSSMRGGFFCFLDADDIYTRESLSRRLEVFERNENAEFVDGSVEIMDAGLENMLERRIHTFNGNPLRELCKINEACFFGPTWMIRRRKGKVYHFHQKMTHGEDLLFYISLARDGLYTAVKETVYIYRKRNDSAMSNIEGLENGYSTILSELKNVPGVSKSDLQNFKKRITNIMVRTYLKSLKFQKALRVINRFNKNKGV